MPDKKKNRMTQDLPFKMLPTARYKFWNMIILHMEAKLILGGIRLKQSEVVTTGGNIS